MLGVPYSNFVKVVVRGKKSSQEGGTRVPCGLVKVLLSAFFLSKTGDVEQLPIDRRLTERKSTTCALGEHLSRI